MAIVQWTGREARALRTALRLSGRAFAEYLDVAYRSVAEWDRRGAAIVPGDPAQQLLDIALSRATEEQKQLFSALLPQNAAGPALPAPPLPVPVAEEEREEDMDRRRLLRLLTLAGAAVSLPAFSHGVDLDHLAHPSPLDATAVSGLENLTSGPWEVYTHAETKGAVYPAVRAHLDTLTSRLAQCQHPEIRRRLCAVLANALQLTGEIQFDRDSYANAAHCYTQAANAAREADAPDLWACALTRHAFISLYERQFTDALPLLEMAGRAAHRGDSQLATRHWISAVTAQAHAGTGDLGACQRSWDCAETVADLPDTAAVTTGWLRFTGDRLAEERGASYVELGRPDLAAPVLTAAMAAPVSARRRGGISIDLAAVGLQRQDAEQFRTFATAALETTRQTQSGYLARRLGSLQRRATEAGLGPQATDLAAEITSVVTGIKH